MIRFFTRKWIINQAEFSSVCSVLLLMINREAGRDVQKPIKDISINSSRVWGWQIQTQIQSNT